LIAPAARGWFSTATLATEASLLSRGCPEDIANCDYGSDGLIRKFGNLQLYYLDFKRSSFVMGMWAKKKK
jgi:hypothetical protein